MANEISNITVKDSVGNDVTYSIYDEVARTNSENANEKVNSINYEYVQSSKTLKLNIPIKGV